MIQDLENAFFDNAYKEQQPEAGDYIIFVKERSVLVKKDSEKIEFPRFEEINAKMGYIYLFQIDINGNLQKFFLGESGKLACGMLEAYDYGQQNMFSAQAV